VFTCLVKDVSFFIRLSLCPVEFESVHAKTNRNRAWTEFYHLVPDSEEYNLSGAQPALHFGGGNSMKFHSMTSSCLLNRGTTFSQTITYNNNNNVFFPADTKSIVQTHTFCTTLVNENRPYRTFRNSVGGWITGVKRNFWREISDFTPYAHAQSRAVASGGAVVPGPPPFEIGATPISRLAPRLWHTSNTAFTKCGPPFRFLAPPSGFWPPLLLSPGDGPGTE